MHLVPPATEPVLQLLAHRYPDVETTRALWRFAGGDEADVTPAEERGAHWERLWARAGADAAVTRLALVREALFDAPGDAELLLAAAQLGPSHRAAAAELVRALESLDESAGDAAFWIALASYPTRAFTDAYASLVQAFEGRLAPAKRLSLQDRLNRLAPSSALPSAGAALEGLARLVERCETPPLAKLPESLAALRAGTSEERRALSSGLASALLPVERQEDFERAASATALRRRLEVIGALEVRAALPLGRLPAAVVAVLWSTRSA